MTIPPPSAEAVKRYDDQEIFDCLNLHHMSRGPYVQAYHYDALAAERDELRMQYITSAGETQTALEQRDALTARLARAEEERDALRDELNAPCKGCGK